MNAFFIFLSITILLTFIFYKQYISPLSLFVILILFVSIIYKKNVEPFVGMKTHFWDIHYQDKVMFYNKLCLLESSLIRNSITANCTISDITKIPTSLRGVNFVVEDGSMSHGSYRGNTNILKYNTDTYIQSQSRNDDEQTYISYVNKTGIVTNNRDKSAIFQFESPNNIKRKNIRYGDQVYIKHVESNMYLKLNNVNNSTTENISLVEIPDENCKWKILDQMGYGDNIKVDWARIAQTTHSSTWHEYPFYPSSFCNDGNDDTICHSNTMSDTIAPWIHFQLPFEVNISEIKIVNRKDCCLDRLGKFVVSIKNSNNQTVFEKEYEAKSDSKFVSIKILNIVGSKVKIQLSNTGENRILNLATVSIFGNPVYLNASQKDTQTLLNRPIQLSKNKDIPLDIDVSQNVNLYCGLFFKETLQQDILTLGDMKLSMNASGSLQVSLNSQVVSTKKCVKNKMYMIRVILVRGIRLNNGIWTLVVDENNNNYLLSEKYKLHYTIQNRSTFPELSKFVSRQINSAYLQDFVYMGSYENNSKGILYVYLNDGIVGEKTLENDFDLKNKVVLSSFSGLIGPLTVTSRIESKETVSFKNTLHLGNHILATKKDISIKDTQLGVHQDFTLSFWIKIENTNDERTCILNKKVHSPDGIVVSEFAPMIEVGKNLTDLYVRLQDNTGKHIELMIPYIFINMEWNLISLSMNRKKCVVSINANKQTKKTHVQKEGYLLFNNYSPIHVSGCIPLIGKIHDMQFSNYILSDKELFQIYQNKPYQSELHKIKKQLNSVGCIATTIDPESEVYLLGIYKDKSKVHTLKQKADAYIQNPYFSGISESEGLNAVGSCYGETARKMIRRLMNVKKNIHELTNKEIKMNLLKGTYTGNSTLVIGPRMANLSKNSYSIECMMFIRDISVNVSHVFSVKFLDNNKHAYNPQLCLLPNSTKFVIDTYTTEGIEQLESTVSLPKGRWFKLNLSVYNQNRVSVYVDDKFLESMVTIGTMYVTNVFEFIIGKYNEMNIDSFYGFLRDIFVTAKSDGVISKKNEVVSEMMYLSSPNASVTKKSTDPLFSVHFWMYVYDTKMLCQYLLSISVTETKQTFNMGIKNESIFIGNSVKDNKLKADLRNWNYITLTHSGDIFILYVNGVISQKIKISENTNKSSRTVELKFGICNSVVLRNVVFSNYILTESDIQSHMSGSPSNSDIGYENNKMIEETKVIEQNIKYNPEKVNHIDKLLTDIENKIKNLSKIVKK